MGASSSVGLRGSCQAVESAKAQELLLKFKRAVFKAAGLDDLLSDMAVCDEETQLCEQKVSSCDENIKQEKLKLFFESVDTNHDGKLDKAEIEALIQQLNFDMSEDMKRDLRKNMKELFLSMVDDSFSLIMDQFLQFVVSDNFSTTTITSDQPKRVVFVGATGAGKSLLCTVITGHSKQDSPFPVGSDMASTTAACSDLLCHWFGDNSQEQFMCIDTPGLDDHLGRDEDHINLMIEHMQTLEYVNTVVFCLKGDHPKFSQSLQSTIKKFEDAFTPQLYKHCIILITHWKMDEDSVLQREEEGRSEETIAVDLNNNIKQCDLLQCKDSLKVICVDTNSKRPSTRQKLELLRDSIGSEVFRTADLTKIVPRIKEISNESQVVILGGKLATMTPVMFDAEVMIREWEVRPELPPGVTCCCKGRICGSPKELSIRQEYMLYARSAGGWSEGFPVVIEVAHSPKEIKAVVSEVLTGIGGKLEELFMREEENPPYDNPDPVIYEASTLGESLLVKRIEILRQDLGGFSTFDEIVKNLSIEYDNKFLTLKERFLSMCSKCQLNKERTAERCKNDIELHLVRQTPDINFLERLVSDAIAAGVDDEVLGRARAWIQSLQPGPCSFACNGCPLTNLIRVDRIAHEEYCLFGLSLRDKSCLEYVNPLTDDGKVSCVRVVCQNTLSEATWNGKYAWDAECGEYSFINKAAGKLLRLRPLTSIVSRLPEAIQHQKHPHELVKTELHEGRGFDCKVCYKPGRKWSYSCMDCDQNTFHAHPECVIDFNEIDNKGSKWALTSSYSQYGQDTVEFVSENEVENPLELDFSGFEISSMDIARWKENPEPVHPSNSSLKIIYFGGKWCPYCPPFTKLLSAFYADVVDALGRASIDVIFISSDANAEEMLEYYSEAHGDWLAIPFEHTVLKAKFSEKYSMKGIPHCIVVNDALEEIPLAFTDNKDMRALLAQLPGEQFLAERKRSSVRMHELLTGAVAKSCSRRGAENDEIVDFFCSLRYAEAHTEALMVQAALKERNFNAVIIGVQEGQDICSVLVDKLEKAKVCIIFGSETYGQETESSFR